MEQHCRKTSSTLLKALRRTRVWSVRQPGRRPRGWCGIRKTERVEMGSYRGWRVHLGRAL